MDCKLGIILTLSNNVTEVLPAGESLEVVIFVKEGFTETIRNNAASKRNILAW
jgi:hypothetical protein